jgi:hypothetical protein
MVVASDKLQSSEEYLSKATRKGKEKHMNTSFIR